MDVLFYLVVIGMGFSAVPIVTIFRREPMFLELRRKRMLQSAQIGLIGMVFLGIAALIAAVGASVEGRGVGLHFLPGLFFLAVGLRACYWFYEAYKMPGDRVVNNVLTTIVALVMACFGTAGGLVLIIRAMTK